jgi:hypothetical protein
VVTDGGKSDGRDIITTYRYLRISIAASAVWLFASVTETATSTHCIQNSLSAFYYTVTHSAFIGALCIIAGGLIVYQGSIFAEEVLLDFSGFMALVVAMVPTMPAPKNDPFVLHPCGLSLPTEDDGTVGTINNVTSLLIAIAAGLLIYWAIRPLRRDGSDARQPATDRTDAFPRFAGLLFAASRVVVPLVVLAVLIAGAAWLAAAPDDFRLHAHRYAALAMFAGIALVAVFNACYAALEGRATALAYIVIAVLMTLTLVVLILLFTVVKVSGRPAILLFESALIIEFAAFWLIQTRDLWHLCRYRPKPVVRA